MSRVYPLSEYDAPIAAAEKELRLLRYHRGCERKRIAWSSAELRKRNGAKIKAGKAKV